jgi:hypothetical protein
MNTKTKWSRHAGLWQACRHQPRRTANRLGLGFVIVAAVFFLFGHFALLTLGLALYVWVIGIALSFLISSEIDFSFLLNLVGYPVIVLSPLFFLLAWVFMKSGEWLEGIGQPADRGSAPIVRKP